MLAELSPFGRQMFLHFLPYPFECPDHLPGNMVTVDYNGGLWKTNFCNVPEMRVHVHDEIFNLFSVFKLMEVADQIGFFAVGKNVHDLFIFCISQDRLVFLTVCISFEFIYGENLRQLLAGIVYKIKVTEGRAD